MLHSGKNYGELVTDFNRLKLLMSDTGLNPALTGKGWNNRISLKLIDSFTSGIAVFESQDSGANFICLALNGNGRRICELDNEKAIGVDLENLFPSCRETGLLELFQTVYRTGQPGHLPLRHFKHNRLDRWLENHVFRLPNRNIVTVFDSRSTQQSTESALRESQEEYARLFNTMLNGMAIHEIIVDEYGKPCDYRFLNVNPRFEELTGLKAESIIGRTVLEILPETEQYWIDTYGRVALTGEPVTFSHYANELKKHFQVAAYSPVKGQFVCVFTDMTSVKEAEQALMDSKERLRRFYESVQAGIVVHDANGVIIHANAIAADILELNLDELVGNTSTDPRWKMIDESGNSVPGSSHPAMITLATGESMRGVVRGIYAENPETTKWLIINTDPILYDDSGKVIEAIATFIDITPRKRMETELRKREQFLSAVLDLSPLGISVRDCNGRLLSYNRSWQRIWAIPDSEIARDMQRPRKALALDKRDTYLSTWKKELTELYRNGGTLVIPEAQTLGLRPGSAGWVSQIFYAIPGENTPVERVVIITQDITDRKNAEAAIRESEERFYKAFRHAPLLIIISRLSDNVLIDANDVFCQEIGFSRKELIGSTLADVGVISEELMLTLAAEFAETGYFNGVEVELTCQDGEKLLVNAFGEPISIRGSKHAVLIGENITEKRRQRLEREQLEHQLKQSQKLEALGTLAGGIAHDFNNILFGILGYADLLREALGPDEKLHRYVNQIIAGGNRATELVKQILTFARRSQQHRSDTDIIPLIKESVKLMQSTLPASIEIRLDLRTDRAVVLCDPTEIHQVIMNLCTNAGYAMLKTGGRLTISLSETVPDHQPDQEEPEKPAYLLEVADTGPGIPMDIIDKVFDPFFTTKPVGQGTGMGLSVVHSIVKSLDGNISITSDPGRGTTFRVMIPATAEQPQPAPVELQPLPTGSESVIVVDDEFVLTEIISQMLTGLGYRVEAYTDSQKALECFINNPGNYDLAILDQSMPNLPGSELAQKMMTAVPGFPIIICTGYSHILTPAKAKAMGIKLFMYKPISRRDLAHGVRQVLEAD